MSLKTISLNVGGTLSASGGTVTSLKSLGNNTEYHNLIIDDGTSIGEQTNLKASVKRPRVDSTAPNGYTQARNTLSVYRPVTPSGGVRTLNSVAITVSVDPSSTDAQVTELVNIAGQLMTDSDAVDFFTDQSVV